MVTAEFFLKRFEEETIKGREAGVFRTMTYFETPMSFMTGLVQGRPALLCRCKLPSRLPDSSAAVDVSSISINGDEGYLAFIEKDAGSRDLFSSLCADLVGVAMGCQNESQGLSQVLSRYGHWKKFWRSGNCGLSEEKVRGLAGELLYFEHCLNAGISPDDVCAAWHGVLAKDQDFVFANSWIEVKTVRQAAFQVEISSIEQLENSGLDKSGGVVPGHLVVIRLHDDPSGDQTFTLVQLYDRIRAKLSGNPNALLAFLNIFDQSGANLALGKFEKSLVMQMSSLTSYLASAEDFPRLKRDLLPQAVAKVRYSLVIPSLEPWRES